MDIKGKLKDLAAAERAREDQRHPHPFGDVPYILVPFPLGWHRSAGRGAGTGSGMGPGIGSIIFGIFLSVLPLSWLRGLMKSDLEAPAAVYMLLVCMIVAGIILILQALDSLSASKNAREVQRNNPSRFWLVDFPGLEKTLYDNLPERSKGLLGKALLMLLFMAPFNLVVWKPGADPISRWIYVFCGFKRIAS